MNGIDELMSMYPELEEKEETQVDTAALQQNMGHRLLCPVCRKFKKHEISMKIEAGVPILLLRCRVCENTDTYILTERGFMEKNLHERFKEFSKQRAKEEVKRQ